MGQLNLKPRKVAENKTYRPKTIIHVSVFAQVHRFS